MTPRGGKTKDRLSGNGGHDYTLEADSFRFLPSGVLTVYTGTGTSASLRKDNILEDNSL